MKKTLLAATSAMVLAVSVASSAYAKDGFYLAVRGGNTNYNLNNKKDSSADKAREDYGDTWHVAGALGYKYKYFRLEGEYTYRDDIDDNYINHVGGTLFSERHVKLETETFLLNAYLDFMPNYWISPYISGGIGMSRLKLNERTLEGDPMPLSEEDKNFTWALGAGLSLRLNRCLNLDAGYRYVDMGELGKAAEYTLHEVYGGLRFTF